MNHYNLNNINRLEIIDLFETYKNLLTNKQIEYFTLYFFEDNSLTEISQQFNVSKIAISDSLTKTINTLKKYETALNFNYFQKELLKIIKNEKEIIKLKDKIIKLLSIDNEKE